MAVSAASAMSLKRSISSLDLAADARAARARRSAQPSNKEGLEDPTLETPLKDTGLPPSPPAPPIDGRTLFDLEVEEEDNEIARRSIVERLFKNVSWDTIGEDARANLYYYALDHGLLAETLEEQERQGTASGQDAPLHGLQPGRMSHGSSDEELVCDHCRREIREIRILTGAPCKGADIFFTGIAFGHTCKNITTVHQSRPSLHRPSR